MTRSHASARAGCIGLWLVLLSLIAVDAGAQALTPQQLNEHCTVSVLNRNVRANADGSWVLPNVPANFGKVRARATCVIDGMTVSGESEPFEVPANGVVNIPEIRLGETTKIPALLTITAETSTLDSIGDSVQLTVDARYSDGSTRTVTDATTGTGYTISNTAIATVSSDGLVTAFNSGTALIQATHEGTSAIFVVRVILDGQDSDAYGIPDSDELTLGLSPTNATDAAEDFDRDGLTNLDEFRLGTDLRIADMDGDGLTDGVEARGTNGFQTDPRLWDTDSDGISDGLEIQTGSSPIDASSVSLAAALLRIRVTPAKFYMSYNTIAGESSVQLSVIGDLRDGRTLDLTSTARGTNYQSSDFAVCSFGGTAGQVFAGETGSCVITASNGAFTVTSVGTIATFVPTPLGFVDVPGEANGVAVNGSHAFIAAGAAGLQVVDVSDRRLPRVVASLDTAGHASRIRVVGNLAYLAAGAAGLQILDVSDPLHPAQVGAVFLSGYFAADVVVRDGFAYVAEVHGISIIDVRVPSAPTLIGSLQLGGEPRGIAIADDASFAVVTAPGEGVHVVSLANPSQPTLLATRAGGSPQAVAVRGDHALVADLNRSLTVINVSNPANPVVGVSLPLELGGMLRDIAVLGDFAFGADIFFVNGVPIVDISDPSTPNPRAILDFRQFRDDDGAGIAVDTQYIYLTARLGNSRLYIGQYRAPSDNGGAAPQISLVAPFPGTSVAEGRPVSALATAVDDIGVAAVTFFVNDQAAFVATAAPYQYTFNAPSGVAEVTIRAEAVDFGGNVGVSEQVSVAIVAGGGNISGRVTDAASASPLPNVIVNIYNAAGALVAAITSDAQGEYRTGALDPGTYYATTSGTLLHVNGLYSGRYCANCAPTTGTPIAVANGASATNINFALNRFARITGGVTDAATGAFLPGIEVAAHDATNRFITHVLTAADGTYTLQGLVPGPIYLRTFSSGYYINQLYGGKLSDSFLTTNAAPVTVTPGATVTSINFALERGGRISGRVIDAVTGDGATNVNVDLFSPDRRYVSSGWTGASGNFVSNGLPAGTYFARTANSSAYFDQLFDGTPCLGCDVTLGRPIQVTTGETTDGVNFTLQPGGGVISGHVTDADTGKAVGYGSVDIFNAAGTWVTSAYFDPFGPEPTAYRTRGGLPAGVYYARTASFPGYIREVVNDRDCASCPVTSGTPIHVALGTVTPDIDFTLRRGGFLAGRITDATSGAGLPNVNVQVFDSAGGWATAVDTDDNGRFVTTEGMPTGNYFVRTWNTGTYITGLYGRGNCISCDVRTGTSISVVAGQTTANIDLELTRGGRITGFILDAVTGGAATTASILVRDANGAGISGVGIDGLGAFASEALPPGTYYIRTANNAGYFNLAFPNVPCSACDHKSGTPIVITTGNDTPATFLLAPGGGWISGRVVDDTTGAAVSTAWVEIYDANGNRVSYGNPAWWRLDPSAYTIEDGLPPGTYYARAHDNSGSITEQYAEFECVVCPVTSGTPIVVTAGVGTTDVNFTLSKGGLIRGRVTDAATGAGIGNAWIHVEDAAGQFVTGGSTNANGEYVTQVGLPTGSYYLRTFQTPGYVSGVYPGKACLGCSAARDGGAVAVVGGETTTGVDFVLTLGGTIAGRLTDAATGAGIAGANVQVFDLAGRWVTAVDTSATGEYVLQEAVPTGSYRVRTWNAGNYLNSVFGAGACTNCDTALGTNVNVVAGGVINGIDLALTLGGRISGRIVDASTGLAVRRAWADVFSSSGSFVTNTQVLPDGAYVTQGMPPGSYFVRTSNQDGYFNRLFDALPCVTCSVTTGAPVLVSLGAVKGGIDFALTSGGGMLTGRVTDAATGEPLRVVVDVFNTNGSYVGGGWTDMGAAVPGTFVVNAGLPAGQYFARTTTVPSGYVPMLYDGIDCPSCNVTTGTPIAVTLGATTTTDFALSIGGQISGRVRDAATGNSILGVRVNVHDSLNRIVATGTTDASGLYTSTPGLPTGTYFARTTNSLGYVDGLHAGQPCLNCSATTGTPISVTKGNTTPGIDFALSQGARISGRVTDVSTTAALSGVSVQATNVNGAFVASAFTDASGHYVIQGLLAGTYFVRASSSTHVGALFGGIECFACAAIGGTPVEVAVGQLVAGVDLSLTLGGRITGRVVDAATGAPLSSTFLTLFDSTGAAPFGLLTAPNGVFTSSALPAGSYYMVAEGTQGRVSQVFGGGDCSPCTALSGTAIQVSAGSVTGSVDFSLRTGSRITGRVTDLGSGQPIAAARLLVYDATGRIFSSTTSDATGQYTILGLVPGTYHVLAASTAGYVPQLYSGTECLGCVITSGSPVHVTGPDSTTSAIDFALRRGAQVSGRVSHLISGAVVPSASVNIFDLRGVLVTTASTNAAGMFLSTDALSPGMYYARATVFGQMLVAGLFNGELCLNCAVVRGTPFEVTSTTTVTGIDFRLTPGGRIVGRVVDEDTGAALRSATVRIFDDSLTEVATVVSDASGIFQSPPLPAGSYTAQTGNVLGYVNELYQDLPCQSCSPAVGTRIDVAAGQLTGGIGFTLRAGARIQGQITNAETATPFPGVTANIFDASGNVVANGTSNAAGQFLSGAGLLPGAYFVTTSNTAGFGDQRHAGQPCIGGQCDAAAGTPVVLGDRAIEVVGFALEPLGRITGRVTDQQSGAGIGSVTVRLFTQNGSLAAQSATDATGSFSSTGLPTGSYYAVTSNALGYTNRLYGGPSCYTCVATEGTAISVTEGVTTPGVDFSLSKGGAIVGNVRTTLDEPLDGVTVQVLDTQGGVVAAAITDTRGAFEIDGGLAPGIYTVRSRNTDGLVDDQISVVVSVAATTRVMLRLSQ